MTKRERFLAACQSQPVDQTPIWIMRQAGRYLPEYRALKEKYDFLTLVKTPELATEVTLQPLQRFPLDAAILFSDILVIPEALGQPYHFREQGGIGMDYTLDSAEKIHALDSAAIPEKLAYVANTLTLLRRELPQHALLGFGGSPWTLATYMIEGGSSKHFDAIKTLYFSEPACFESLMNTLCTALIDYFRMQVEAGVDAIQIFDSWGSLCPGYAYWDMSLKWIHRIIEALSGSVPIILYAKGMGHHMELLLKTGAQVISLDWTMKLDEVHKTYPGNYALQGNLDPTILNTTPDIVRRESQQLLEAMRTTPGHIFNLGHGILPNAKVENVETLIKTVQEYKKQLDS